MLNRRTVTFLIAFALFLKACSDSGEEKSRNGLADCPTNSGVSPQIVLAQENSASSAWSIFKENGVWKFNISKVIIPETYPDNLTHILIEKEKDCTALALDWVVKSMNASGRETFDVPVGVLENLIDGLAFLALNSSSQEKLLEDNSIKLPDYNYQFDELPLLHDIYFNEEGELIEESIRQVISEMLAEVDSVAEIGILGNKDNMDAVRELWGLQS